MTPERWEQVKEIFNAALDLSVDEREAFLDEACGDRPFQGPGLEARDVGTNPVLGAVRAGRD